MLRLLEFEERCDDVLSRLLVLLLVLTRAEPEVRDDEALSERSVELENDDERVEAPVEVLRVEVPVEVLRVEVPVEVLRVEVPVEVLRVEVPVEVLRVVALDELRSVLVALLRLDVPGLPALLRTVPVRSDPRLLLIAALRVPEVLPPRVGAEI